MRITQDDENLLTQEMVCQQDGSPPHYYVRVREYLDRTFSG